MGGFADKVIAAATEGGKAAPFDPEGDGYDYARATAAGMRPGADGHWGTVTDASPEDKKRLRLPDESYVMLKGRRHKTWDLGVQGERDRNFDVVKRGDRYYSIPKE